jgi:peptidoglycan/xylan/chitin deacetylase (PgdA/CDA1 family)
MTATTLLATPLSRRALLAGAAGWVAGGLLAPEPLRAAPIVGEAGDDLRAVSLSGVSGTLSRAVSLTATASYSGRVVGSLASGTTVAVLQTSGVFYQVRAGSKTGWTSSWNVILTGVPSTVITRGSTKKALIAMTFDAGSDLGSTNRILDILAARGILATFGLTGAWVDAYPEAARRIVDEGHQVLNHTYDHPSYTGYSTTGERIAPASRVAQLVAAEEEIAALAGGAAKPWWRPPYGDYDSGVLRDAGALGYSKTVMWTVDSMGWAGWSSADITSRVLKRAGNGAIVLMHVGSASKDAQALSGILRTLATRGYGFGRVQDVL